MQADQISQILKQSAPIFLGDAPLRSHQEEAMLEIIQHRDTLVLLPTGGGKSLCYQLPAIHFNATCLVVSPLLALMKDQVQKLKKLDIAAEMLSSELDPELEEQIYEQCKAGLVRLLYVSPERLQSSKFIEQMQEVQISFLAVDEAHCISEWGSDFRPSYQNIKKFRQLFPHLACIALTGTANLKILDDIVRQLALKSPKIIKKSFERSNLSIKHYQLQDKNNFILQFLQQNPQSGIIYARTRKECEYLAYFLQQKGLVNVDFYHAGLTVKEKNRKQKQWLQADNFCLISTNAFGMGIDKANVRFVIHYSPPASVENYYQEIGRAGRDGLPSDCYLLWSQPEINNLDEQIKQQTASKKEFEDFARKLYSLYFIPEHEAQPRKMVLKNQVLKEVLKYPMVKIKAMLNFMFNQELIWLNYQRQASNLEFLFEVDELEKLPSESAYFCEILLRCLPAIAQQKVFFYEEQVAQKADINIEQIKKQLHFLHQQKYVDYFDGQLASIQFLKARNDEVWMRNYWPIFNNIQSNKIQKWEEFKYFIQNTTHCKMSMILMYFGETKGPNCGQCSNCQEQKASPKQLSKDILHALMEDNYSLQQLCIALKTNRYDEVLDNLKELLNQRKIKMLDFKTYSLI